MLPDRDRRVSHLWLVIAALAAAAVALGALLAGCSLGPAVQCPLGSYPTKVDTDRSVDSGGNLSGAVPTQSVAAGGTWKGSGSTDWHCARICRPGQLLRARSEGKICSIECLPERGGPPATPKDGGP